MIFQGKVGLKGAQANVGVPVTDLDATLDIYQVKASDEDWPHTDILIHADQLRVADRLINRCSMHVETGEHPWLIELNDLRALPMSLEPCGSLDGGAPGSVPSMNA